MRRLTLLLLAWAPAALLADTLQFELGKGGAFVKYAPVEIVTQQGSIVYRGTSDGYGRVSASLPAGDYTIHIGTTSGTKSSSIHLFGKNALLKVTL
jgi:hypothetical protein